MSAIAEDGSVVLSLWSHKLEPEHRGVRRYADRLSRWKGNKPGRNLFVEHLTKAWEEQRPVRVILATTNEPQVVDRGEDASRIRKTFSVRRDLTGRVTYFDGDEWVVEFRVS